MSASGSRPGDPPVDPVARWRTNDMRGALWSAADDFELRPDARRFENWEFAHALVLGFGAAARYALEVGVAEAGRRAGALAEGAPERLAAQPRVRVLDRGHERCAIVTAAVEGCDDVRPLVEALRRRGVRTSATLRSSALIDLDEKGVASVLRLPPHYYNTPAEIDRAVEALAELLKS